MMIRSIIQDMKSRSHSHRVVQDASSMAVVADGMTQSCWAHMPQELLREVLLRIEASEATWPQRKSVVACAGVCRSWRHITKDIVKIPQISAKITFPISVKQVSFLPILNGFFSLVEFFKAGIFHFLLGCFYWKERLFFDCWVVRLI